MIIYSYNLKMTKKWGLPAFSLENSEPRSQSLITIDNPNRLLLFRRQKQTCSLALKSESSELKELLKDVN